MNLLKVGAVVVAGIVLLIVLGKVVSFVVGALTAYDGSDAQTIVRDLRLPRMALAVLVGAALGGAGVLMQGTTRNALAEPEIDLFHHIP